MKKLIINFFKIKYNLYQINLTEKAYFTLVYSLYFQRSKHDIYINIYNTPFPPYKFLLH